MSFDRGSYDQGFGDDEGWYDEGPNDFGNDDYRGLKNRQYSNAYGNYRGGYGRQGPYEHGPPGPNGPFGPPPMFGPPMFPRGPMAPPPTIFGRGFGPNGPPALRGNPRESPAIKYLTRCGLARNAVINLPRDLLDLIEPQYCGLCGHSFESFSLSRVHYLSKQHQKSVKKWLTHNSNMSAQNPQEAPLRARELYCELCDVQITSKVHADSHYVGKSHRAVVEGRKNPKNPMLLQPGMERRRRQLIRREKKFLPKVIEAEVKVEEEETKDVKPIQPELYCEICKTAVTCSEQMTAHLNGKRHLAKEKNFILKSMRGEIEAPGAEVKQEVMESEEIEGDTEKKEEDTEKKEGDTVEKAGDAGEEEEWQEGWE